MTIVSYKYDITRGRPVLSMRQKVERLEQSMQGMPPVACPVRHYYAPGMAAREITISKGSTIVGAIHKTENLAILSKGSLELVTDEGTVILEAPCTVTVKSGAKNAATALEDAVWTNFLPNPTNETDPDKLVEMFTYSKASELLGGKDNPQTLAMREREKLENEK